MLVSLNQIDAYARDGFVLVADLIPDDVSAAAADAMWIAMEANPDDRATWCEGFFQGLDDPAIVACYTKTFLAAAATLSDNSRDSIGAPSSALAINIFPTADAWHTPTPHIDHAIKEHGHRTFPLPFRIATMTFLSDVPERGGGTAVWPGSHERIKALAHSDEDKYEYMWVLNQDMERMSLGDPVILTPRRGDVLFYQCLCAHSGSANKRDRPRLALNHKW